MSRQEFRETPGESRSPHGERRLRGEGSGAIAGGGGQMSAHHLYIRSAIPGSSEPDKEVQSLPAPDRNRAMDRALLALPDSETCSSAERRCLAG